MSDRATIQRLLREIQIADRTEKVVIAEEAILNMFDGVVDELNKDIDALQTRAEKAEAENEQLRAALGTAADTIAAVVRGCTYESEEQAKAGVYGISHEAFIKIYEFIKTYEDIRKHALKGGE